MASALSTNGAIPCGWLVPAHGDNGYHAAYTNTLFGCSCEHALACKPCKHWVRALQKEFPALAEDKNLIIDIIGYGYGCIVDPLKRLRERGAKPKYGEWTGRVPKYPLNGGVDLAPCMQLTDLAVLGHPASQSLRESTTITCG